MLLSNLMIPGMNAFKLPNAMNCVFKLTQQCHESSENSKNKARVFDLKQLNISQIKVMKK